MPATSTGCSGSASGQPAGAAGGALSGLPSPSAGVGGTASATAGATGSDAAMEPPPTQPSQAAEGAPSRMSANNQLSDTNPSVDVPPYADGSGTAADGAEGSADVSDEAAGQQAPAVEAVGGIRAAKPVRSKAQQSRGRKPKAAKQQDVGGEGGSESEGEEGGGESRQLGRRVVEYADKIVEEAWAANQLSEVPHTATLDCNELPGIGFKKAGRILATAAVRLLARGEEAQEKGTLHTLLRSAENAGILAQQQGSRPAAGAAAVVGGGAARAGAGHASHAVPASATAAAAAAAAVASMPNVADMDAQMLNACLAAATAAAAAAAGAPSAVPVPQQYGLGQWAVQAAAEIAMKAAAAALQQQQQHASAAAAVARGGAAGRSAGAGPSSAANLLTAAAVGAPDMHHLGSFAFPPSHAGGDVAMCTAAQQQSSAEPPAAPGPLQQMVLEAALLEECPAAGAGGAAIGELPERTLSGPKSSTAEMLQAIFDVMGEPPGASAGGRALPGGSSGGSGPEGGAEARNSDGAAWDFLGQAFESYCGDEAAASESQAPISPPLRHPQQSLLHMPLQHPALAAIAAAEAAGPTGGVRMNGGSITMLDAWVDAQNDEHVDAAVVAAMVADGDDVPRLHETLGPAAGGTAIGAPAGAAGPSISAGQQPALHAQQPALHAPVPGRGGIVSAFAAASPPHHSPGSDAGGPMGPPRRPPICISPPPEDLDPSELRDDFQDLPLTASVFRISNMSIADGPPAPGSARPSVTAFGANPFGNPFGGLGGGGGTPIRLSNALSILRAGSAGCMDMLMSNDFMDALATADPLLAAEVGAAGGGGAGGGRNSNADKFLMSIDALPLVPPLLPSSLIPPGFANALIMTTGDAGAGVSSSWGPAAAAGAAAVRRHHGAEAHAALERVAEEERGDGDDNYDNNTEGAAGRNDDVSQGQGQAPPERWPRRGAAARSAAPRAAALDEEGDEAAAPRREPRAPRPAAGGGRAAQSAGRQQQPQSPQPSRMMTSPMRASPAAPTRTFAEGPSAAAAVAAAGAIIAPPCRAVAGVLGGGTTVVAMDVNMRPPPPHAAAGPSFSAPFGGGGGGRSLSGAGHHGMPATARALFMMDGAGVAGGGSVTFMDRVDQAESMASWRMPPPPPQPQHRHGHHHNAFGDPRYGVSRHQLEDMQRQQLSAPAVLERPGAGGAAISSAGGAAATSGTSAGVSGGGGCGGGGVGGGSGVSSVDQTSGLFAGPAAMLASLTAAAAAAAGSTGIASSAPQPQAHGFGIGTGPSSGSQIYASAASAAAGSGASGMWAEQQRLLQPPVQTHSQAAADMNLQAHRDKTSPLRTASFSRGSVGSSTRSPRRAHLNAAIQAVVKAANASPSPSPLARGSDGWGLRRGGGAAAGFAGGMDSPLAGGAAATGGSSRAGSVAPQLPPLPSLPPLADRGSADEQPDLEMAGAVEGVAPGADEGAQESGLAAAIGAAISGSVGGRETKGGAKAGGRRGGGRGGGHGGAKPRSGGGGVTDIGGGSSDDMDAGAAGLLGGVVKPEAATEEGPFGLAALGRGSRMHSDNDEEAGGGGGGGGAGGGEEDDDGAGFTGSEEVNVVNLRKVTQDGMPRQLTKQSLKDVYHLPINEAAAALNIGVTVLKKYCRKFSIPRWPYRKLNSVNKLMETFDRYKRDALLGGNFTGGEECEVVLQSLAKMKIELYEDPDKDIDERIKKLRQANFKVEYRARQDTTGKQSQQQQQEQEQQLPQDEQQQQQQQLLQQHLQEHFMQQQQQLFMQQQQLLPGALDPMQPGGEGFGMLGGMPPPVMTGIGMLPAPMPPPFLLPPFDPATALPPQFMPPEGPPQ
ncbi:hypothetical protein HXX76_004211, partial [Chlamydomonas incerta]